ncbi:hypothetical protein ACFLT1_08515 [Bacteroidota bacterium]
MHIPQIDILHDIFNERITVINISNNCDILTLEEAKKICSENNFDVQLVKDEDSSDVKVYERIAGVARPLRSSEVISEATPIIEVLELLLKQPYAFIKERREITRIVTNADLDSIPIRIWLFGMISLFEKQIRIYIQKNDLNWETCLSEDRLNDAQKLFIMKTKRNEEVDLIDCAQLVDLGSIVKKLSSHYIFEGGSKTKTEKFFFKLNKLRDELAHTQKLTLSWKVIFDHMNIVHNTLSKHSLE